MVPDPRAVYLDHRSVGPCEHVEQLVVPLARNVGRVRLRTHQADVQPDRVAFASRGELPIMRHDRHPAIDRIDRDLIIGGRHSAAKTYLGGRDHVVAAMAEERCDGVINVVVEQKSHYALADECRAASTSSRVSSGNASKMRSSGRPRSR